jgi:hypothetical protein
MARSSATVKRADKRRLLRDQIATLGPLSDAIRKVATEKRKPVKVRRPKPFEQVPYPLASVVRFVGSANVDQYLVESIHNYDGFPKYSILGHRRLKTKGEGSAWHDHEELELVRAPDGETWKWLAQAKSEGV